MGKELINLSNLQRFLSKLSEKFALKKAMKGISEDAEGNIIIGEEGLVPTPNENSKGKFLRSDGEWALPSVYDSMTIEEGVAGVSKVDKVLSAKNLKQIVNSDGFLTSLDSSKLTGVINIENLPQGALERILIVSSKEERLTLLDTEVQLGDVVKESDTGLMYYVINTEKLNSEEGYTQFTAGQASSVPWSGVTDKPTIPTKTSDLTNDSDFAIDSGVVHKTGNETINGTKTFTSILKISQGTLQVGSDAGNSVTYSWTGDIISKQPSGTFNISLPKANGTLAIDENLVHRTGNETIAGSKSFTEVLDRRNDVTTSTVATATQLVDTNANRCGWIANRMHWTGNYHVHNRHIAYNENSGKEVCIDIISSNDGLGGLFVSGTAINRNLYDVTSSTDYSLIATMGWVNNPATSTNVVHRSGNETINGIKIFTDNIYKKNSALDLQVNPSSDQYNSFLFTDKNNVVMGYLEHIQMTTGVNAMGLYARDKNNATHGFQVTSEDNVIPLGNGVVNLGLSGAKWKNVYATTFNGNLKGNADSSTKASYLDNYSLPGGNKIYLDWSGQKKDYVGLKVDNTLMGGLITTNNIGSQSVNSATYATSAGSAAKATQDSVGQQINKTYIKELSVSGRTITYKRGDNTTGTITTQDTNTTYSKLSQFTNDSGYITSSGSCNYATTAGSAGNGIDSYGEGWIRFKNGIQICFGEGTSGQNNSFPKAFKSGSVPHVNIMHYTNNNLPYCATGQQGTHGSTTNATFNFLLWSLSSSTYVNYTGCHYIAIGTWK